MSSSRKEWRIVSDQPVQNSHGEDSEPSKLVQLDERTIYEVQQGQQLDIDFCPVTEEDGIDHEILQQRVHNVTRQREELQGIEIEIKAQVMARSRIMEMRRAYSKQINTQTTAAVNLQEQLHEKEQSVRELERKIEEKERELRDNQLANEAVWAKEDLLREQNNELVAFRREREKSQAERTQHIKQIHELQEHIQEKERQLIELQEQNRIAQETILFKDEQLREAQSWISRVQEMDALQSSTNHSLQAELRERTEQYNQLWIGCQRQFAEMERLHLHSIQQLQLDMAEARSGAYIDKLTVIRTNPKDGSHDGQNERESIGHTSSNIASGLLPNGNAGVSAQTDPVHGHQITPPSTLDKPAYISSGGHVAPLYPYVMQQGVPSSVPSHGCEHHTNQFQPMPGCLPHWQNQQHIVNVSQIPSHNQSSQETQGGLHMDPKHDVKVTANGNSFHTSYIDVQLQEGSDQLSMQFNDALRLNARHNITSEEKTSSSNDQGIEKKSDCHSNHGGQEEKEMAEKFDQMALLDEKSLLACIVRTIPPSSGGKIRMSSTLPNRLSRMLAPLHWHDYKRKYGRLEDFVGCHPELFVIRDDFIQLREGAQEIIAATAAVAKVAAAAASLPSSSSLQSVAVTPVAQSYRPKPGKPSKDGITRLFNNVRNGSNPGILILEQSKAEGRTTAGSPRG